MPHRRLNKLFCKEYNEWFLKKKNKEKQRKKIIYLGIILLFFVALIVL